MIRCAYNGNYNKDTRVSACKDFIYGLKEEYSEIYISAKDGGGGGIVLIDSQKVISSPNLP